MLLSKEAKRRLHHEVYELLQMAYFHGQTGKFPNAPSNTVELFIFMRLLSTEEFDPKLAKFISGDSICTEESLYGEIHRLVGHLKWQFELPLNQAGWRHANRCVDRCASVLYSLPALAA